MAIRKPIVWNNTDKIFEQLQPGDMLDVQSSITVDFNSITDPIGDVAIDLNDNIVDLKSSNVSLLKVDPTYMTTTIGGIFKIERNNNGRSFYINKIVTMNEAPHTIMFKKNTRCFIIRGDCYARNITSDKDNLVNVEIVFINDSNGIAEIQPVVYKTTYLIQQMNVDIHASVFNNIVTFSIAGIGNNHIEWAFNLEIIEME